MRGVGHRCMSTHPMSITLTQMKKILFKSSYNMDVLSFLNIMSSDEYYVDIYRDDYNMFYPLLSNEIKSIYKAFLENINRSNIAVALLPLFPLRVILIAVILRKY